MISSQDRINFKFYNFAKQNKFPSMTIDDQQNSCC